MKPEILLLVPTLPEIEPFLRQQGKGYGPVVTGIGPYRCAAATQEAIIQRRPDMMILCGIAGRYPASALAVGDAVLVGSERAADMGSFEGKGFVPKFSERYDCPHIPADAPLPVVASNSVSGAASPHVDRSAAQIENMEGAAFFDVCLREQAKADTSHDQLFSSLLGILDVKSSVYDQNKDFSAVCRKSNS